MVCVATVQVYASLQTSLQVCDVVSEKHVGQMRIQFWRDTIDTVYKVIYGHVCEMSFMLACQERISCTYVGRPSQATSSTGIDRRKSRSYNRLSLQLLAFAKFAVNIARERGAVCISTY